MTNILKYSEYKIANAIWIQSEINKESTRTVEIINSNQF